MCTWRGAYLVRRWRTFFGTTEGSAAHKLRHFYCSPSGSAEPEETFQLLTLSPGFSSSSSDSWRSSCCASCCNTTELACIVVLKGCFFFFLFFAVRPSFQEGEQAERYRDLHVRKNPDSKTFIVGEKCAGLLLLLLASMLLHFCLVLLLCCYNTASDAAVFIR